MRENLPRFLHGQGAGFKIMPQIFSKNFIQAADSWPVAAQPFKSKQEPDALHRFSEIPGLSKRYLTQAAVNLRVPSSQIRKITPVPDSKRFHRARHASKRRLLISAEFSAAHPVLDLALLHRHAAFYGSFEIKG